MAPLLPVLIEAITGPADVFRCTPYSARLMATTCAMRQRRLLEVSSSRERYTGVANVGDYNLCRACPDGARVAARLELAPHGETCSSSVPSAAACDCWKSGEPERRRAMPVTFGKGRVGGGDRPRRQFRCTACHEIGHRRTKCPKAVAA